MAEDGPRRFDNFAAELLQDAPCGIAVADPDSQLIYVNSTLAGWVGRAASDLETSPFSGLLTKPGQMFYETHMAPMVRLQGFVREISCHLDVSVGPPMPVLLSGVARYTADGHLDRIDYTIFDARERRSYEEALRSARFEADELAAIVRSSPNAILRVDPQGVIKSWNRGAEKLLGQRARDVLQKRVDTVVPLKDRENWLADAIAGIRGHEEVVFEAEHETGQEIELTAAAIGDPGRSGEGRDISIVIRDISARKQAERRLRVMVDEMSHRVKNTLGVVSGMARQTLSSDDSTAFIARLQALAHAHDALTQSHWTAVDLRDLLSFSSMEAGGPPRFEYNGPQVMLDPRQATSLSMAFHELVTNALKYGALSQSSGRVDVTYDLKNTDSGDVLELRWRERGGPKVVPPTRTGFGSKMIRTLLAAECQAKTQFDFEPQGLTCLLEFPTKPI